MYRRKRIEDGRIIRDDGENHGGKRLKYIGMTSKKSGWMVRVISSVALIVAPMVAVVILP